MKPKYSLLNNTKYAIEGILSLIKNETSFCIELSIIIPAIIISFFLPISLLEHLFLIFVLILILIVEALNSAIESCVDLITNEWNEKAKIAKDCGSSAVFFSVILALFTWGMILGRLYL
ncbi:diacylglycerol kinase [Campylobacter sp. TTU-622]|uniref:diacylglycerol kinase n=1 Tax=unclassified Campylobacter TaxID=2593542 RepID=UPI0019081205|nr:MULTISPECIES: diacylglycerol kinase [unclassified Campylobacter]MBK1971817.1 diacylglycerol kinase [Campylobacter sp. TTU_617]MBK1972716.1 diacylglycerol kinase [Campylobacter sp. TTU-622]MBK1991919.1 diacylglycerol kinase [Campylobacter sp. 2018MI34]